MEIIDSIVNFLLGLIDHTYDNGKDSEEKLREVEKCKLKNLRRDVNTRR